MKKWGLAAAFACVTALSPAVSHAANDGIWALSGALSAPMACDAVRGAGRNPLCAITRPLNCATSLLFLRDCNRHYEDEGDDDVPPPPSAKKRAKKTQ